MITTLQLHLRGLILSFIHRYERVLPTWLHMYLLHDLPFGLSLIDKKTPLTDEDIVIIDELVAKYGVNPQGDGLDLDTLL